MKEVLKYPYKASIGIQYPFGGFFYSLGKPMIPHLFRYQGFAVDDGGLSRVIKRGFALDASNLGHPRLSLI
jgi:hypothetical protein